VHRRDYVHAHVDALVINLEVIRSSALGLGVDRSAAPAPRPSTGSAEGMVDRLKRTCRSPACVGMPIPRIKNAHGIELRTARRGRFSGHVRAERENVRRARPDSCV
jgi:hypothetical protein